MELASKRFATNAPTLHTVRGYRRTPLNRLFAVVYASAILALLYHHVLALFHSTSLVSFFISFSLLISDVVLAFMWSTTQSYRMRPVKRRLFPENLEKVLNRSDFPKMDVFICTADPYKEPPIGVVNTALSVMAYDYPTEKISVYLSDDGGSALTLFAFTEAAKFARHWLPFCRKNNILERSPEMYFRTNHPWGSETQEVKMMYESMKDRVESVLERGKVSKEYITTEQEREVFSKWTDGFTRQDHPTVIEVLLGADKDEDITGHLMPNLIYVSRQKSTTSPHNFKAGALNVLLRVSAAMTNSPIILTLDCDMYSNDPRTPLRVLCYHAGPQIRPNLGFIQFPQIFHGINKNDIYGCEYKGVFQMNSRGIDGLRGGNFYGTGCFFCRRVFFGGPSSKESPEIPELGPDHVVDKPVRSQPLLALAHRVASCNYENKTDWGYKMGFKYGSLVEDYHTSYRLHCEGWQSAFCDPDRPAFMGDAPISLMGMLTQNRRWSVGLLEVGISKYSPVTYGTRSIGPLMALAYAHIAFWAIWSIPITIYAFIPQLALLNGVSIFPNVSNPWFLVYAFLFLGSYGQELLEFLLSEGTVQRWWSDQRMWMLRGVSSFLFGFIECFLKLFGVSTVGFNVTSKVLEEEQSKMYDQGIFVFGAESPMYVTLSMAAIINLVAFVKGCIEVSRGRSSEGLFVQMFIAGFAVVNCWPIYEAMVLRSDKGRMPTKITIISTFLAWLLYTAASLTLKI